jgi:hypothetical protein
MLRRKRKGASSDAPHSIAHLQSRRYHAICIYRTIAAIVLGLFMLVGCNNKPQHPDEKYAVNCFGNVIGCAGDAG